MAWTCVVLTHSPASSPVRSLQVQYLGSFSLWQMTLVGASRSGRFQSRAVLVSDFCFSSLKLLVQHAFGQATISLHLLKTAILRVCLCLANADFAAERAEAALFQKATEIEI
jgi:hypothetical protein